MHTNHHSEHITYPADKMIPVEEAKRMRAAHHGSRTKKFLKTDFPFT